LDELTLKLLLCCLGAPPRIVQIVADATSGSEAEYDGCSSLGHYDRFVW